MKRFAAAAIGLAAAALAVASEPDYRAALAASQAAIGRPAAGFTLRDTEGRPVRFEDYRGRPFVVSFVYTGCFQACPVTTQFLAQAVESARAALGEASFGVLTIGFNQPFDNPAAMAMFARQNRIDVRDWRFLAADAGEVDALTERFGFVYNATPKGFDHITQLSVVDAQGVIRYQVYGESFDLPMLVQPLKSIISGEAEQVLSLENIWTKVKLYCTVYDPFTGRYRWNYSLFFEIFAGLTTLGALAWFLGREIRRRPAP